MSAINRENVIVFELCNQQSIWKAQLTQGEEEEGGKKHTWIDLCTRKCKTVAPRRNKKKKKNVKKGEKKNQKKTQRETGKRDGGVADQMLHTCFQLYIWSNNIASKHEKWFDKRTRGGATKRLWNQWDRQQEEGEEQEEEGTKVSMQIFIVTRTVTFFFFSNSINSDSNWSNNNFVNNSEKIIIFCVVFFCFFFVQVRCVV